MNFVFGNNNGNDGRRLFSELKVRIGLGQLRDRDYNACGDQIQITIDKFRTINNDD